MTRRAAYPARLLVCGRGLLSKRIVYAAIAAFVLGLFIIAASGGSFTGKVQPWPDTKPGGGYTRARIADAPERPSVIDYNRLDARLGKLAEDKSIVGLAVGVVENGDITFLKGYGITDAAKGEPVTSDTVFRWASLSKGVAADMVAKLAAEKKLSLDDPAGLYAASLKLPNGNEKVATIDDLLSQQLGIFAHAEEARLEDGADPKMLRRDLATLKQICPPGECHTYQNVAYDAASEIVEKVSGRPYQKEVLRKLFLPLGMRSASLTRDGLFASPSWAPPHDGGKTSRAVEVTDSYYRVPAAGGVNSSIKDLAIWMRAQMGLYPNVLSPEVLASVQTPRVSTPGEMARMRKFRERLSHAVYGLGWRNYDYAGHRVIGHRGGVRGYRSLILFDPELKSGIVALWNSPSTKPGGLEFEFLDMLYQLPPRDWLDLDDKMKVAGAEPENE